MAYNKKPNKGGRKVKGGKGQNDVDDEDTAILNMKDFKM